ncbi:AAA family ATPase [Verrucosispora sp. WMMA2121]|uniref:ATP-dependent nuclease n=1 Tax=Verrucosispora sp. WMMA2121 TaxID=3015164 RepID=UPI0022B7100E|nr:AAA family ATPase [Verrucosispora sp. WMMA2121]MCZ7421926.1 AAA family ATPase [Verrucosispora sp. WMMA2121]
MFIESVVLDNFQCFGPGRTTVRLDDGLTAFIGANGSGKTAACQALLRIFGITVQERTVRFDDFHVPVDETSTSSARELTIEAVLAFPELDEEESDEDDEERSADEEPGEDDQSTGCRADGRRAVPDFFLRMAATHGADLKVRIVLKAEWVDDGTVDGAITETRMVVSTFAEEYGDDEWALLTPAERSRIQMIYIPASRDGARQVTAFLRSRLWRAAQWSTELRELVSDHAAEVADSFAEEPVVTAVETALTTRWQELHDAGTHAVPKLRLLDDDFNQLIRSSELVFEPDHTGQPRPARLLSDGQRSLLHLALTAATLDVEAAVADGRHDEEFTLDPARLPNLTLIAVEEPENSLSPFFLSRIVNQLQELSGSEATQAILSSHSASTLTRIRPEDIRYFRADPATATAAVREIALPPDDTEAGKYVREAVRAHPELYFAKFVVLGEGDTEQLVIPRIAQAQGVPLDPSFVAVVPLGGRHTNHMWRLLNDLDVPHATLLDLDYGRAGAGPARLRDACKRLKRGGMDPLAELDGYDSVDNIHDDLRLKDLRPILEHLRTFGVFFADPLDLDYTMLYHYPDAYTDLESGERGPNSSDPANAVIGEAGTRRVFWEDADRLDRLRWYRYLFLSRSKPSSHLRALGRLSDDELRDDAPPVVTALVQHVRDKVCL